jgi:hypothetical protein
MTDKEENNNELAFRSTSRNRGRKTSSCRTRRKGNNGIGVFMPDASNNLRDLLCRRALVLQKAAI